MADDEIRRLPLLLGGQYAPPNGDLTLVPEGFCVSVKNLLLRPQRLETRPPFVYDGLMSIRSLTNFDDTTNKVQRLIALDASQNFYEKAASGETWSASKPNTLGTRVTSAANYRGKMYFALDDGSLVPSQVCSFDGTTISASPFNSAIAARCVLSYLDRLFFLYPRLIIDPIAIDCFTGWASGLTNVAIQVTEDPLVTGQTLVTAFPQSTGVGACSMAGAMTMRHVLAATGARTSFMLREDFQSMSPSYSVPLTIKVGLLAAGLTVQRNTAYSKDDIAFQLVGGTTYLMRAKTTGITAGVAPAFTATLGGETVDNTVTWITESTTVVATREIDLALFDGSSWETHFLPISVPAHQNVPLSLTYELDFYNTQNPALTTLVPVNIGLFAGASWTETNHDYGMQVTTGDFHYPFGGSGSPPFVNRTIELNSMIWSEILDVSRVRASSTYELWESPGYPTAGIVEAGRIIAFKRNAFWVFFGNQDVNSLDIIPIRRERSYENVGCISPRAVDKYRGHVFFIGEDDVYRFVIGMDEPEALCGDGMSETIMDRGSNWVESQATYNLPLLAVDQHNREVWVYTQKGKIFIYSLDRKQWVTVTVNDFEIADLKFNPTTRRMYAAIGGKGLARVEWATTAANDTVDNTATTYPVTKEVVTRPLELSADRQDTTIERIAVYQTATADQTGQTLTAYVSFDRGATYPYSDQVTMNLADPRQPIELYESAPSLTLKIVHVGKAGSAVFNISKVEAEVLGLGDEWPQQTPTPGSSTL